MNRNKCMNRKGRYNIWQIKENGTEQQKVNAEDRSSDREYSAAVSNTGGAEKTCVANIYISLREAFWRSTPTPADH